MKDLKYKIGDKVLIEVQMTDTDNEDVTYPYKVKTNVGESYWITDDEIVETPKPELPYGCEYIGKMMEVSDFEDFEGSKETFVVFKGTSEDYPYNTIQAKGSDSSIYKYARPITDKKQSNKKKVKELEKRVKELEALLELKESSKEAEASKTDKKNVNVGDKVKIIGNIYDHEFEIGEIVEIAELDASNSRGEYLHKAYHLNKSDYWYIGEDEFELIK